MLFKELSLHDLCDINSEFWAQYFSIPLTDNSYETNEYKAAQGLSTQTTTKPFFENINCASSNINKHHLQLNSRR